MNIVCLGQFVPHLQSIFLLNLVPAGSLSPLLVFGCGWRRRKEEKRRQEVEKKGRAVAIPGLGYHSRSDLLLLLLLLFLLLLFLFPPDSFRTKKPPSPTHFFWCPVFPPPDPKKRIKTY